MAVAQVWHYTSRYGRHAFVCWQPDNEAPHALPPAHDPALRFELTIERFNPACGVPRSGRHYPARCLRLERQAPAAVLRVMQVDAQRLRVDFNVALAGAAIGLETAHTELAAVGPDALPRGVMRDAGMEMPLSDRATDYSDTEFYQTGRLTRADETADTTFYATPRRVIHIDAVCAARITALYARLLPAGARVLDLMAAWRSHLPDGLGPVSGLGMNAEELADNPALRDHTVHDLNATPRLPYPDASFDAVVNTVSFEYLTEPAAVLAEVRRVLRPGGRLIVTASQRYFPLKAVTLWTHLHPMERLGWLLHQLHQAGFSAVESRVERGLARATGDRYADSLPEMDPLYAVWGDV